LATPSCENFACRFKFLGFADLNQVLLFRTGYDGGYRGEPDILACPKEKPKEIEAEPGTGMLCYKFACSRRRG